MAVSSANNCHINLDTTQQSTEKYHWSTLRPPFFKIAATALEYSPDRGLFSSLLSSSFKIRRIWLIVVVCLTASIGNVGCRPCYCIPIVLCKCDGVCFKLLRCHLEWRLHHGIAGWRRQTWISGNCHVDSSTKYTAVTPNLFRALLFRKSKKCVGIAAATTKPTTRNIFSISLNVKYWPHCH